MQEPFSGYRRRIHIEPREGSIEVELEDDYHHMRLWVEHDAETILRVQSEMIRAPWSPCPGATAKLKQAYEQLPWAQVRGHQAKPAHCTHLFDMMDLAASHWRDENNTQFDIWVRDAGSPGSTRHALIQCNDELLLQWHERAMQAEGGALPHPMGLFEMNPWIKTLPDRLAEAARLLRWGNVIANGRNIPLADQSDATKMPPNCYTFQPETAKTAVRVGVIKDFSSGGDALFTGFSSSHGFNITK